MHTMEHNFHRGSERWKRFSFARVEKRVEVEEEEIGVKIMFGLVMHFVWQHTSAHMDDEYKWI